MVSGCQRRRLVPRGRGPERVARGLVRNRQVRTVVERHQAVWMGRVARAVEGDRSAADGREEDPHTFRGHDVWPVRGSETDLATLAEGRRRTDRAEYPAVTKSGRRPGEGRQIPDFHRADRKAADRGSAQLEDDRGPPALDRKGSVRGARRQKGG